MKIIRYMYESLAEVHCSCCMEEHTIRFDLCKDFHNDSEKDALYVPLECINTQDSINYVVVQSTIGKRKQEVKLGKANENEIIILEGLKEDEEVLLSLPEGMEESPIEKLAI